MLLKVGSVILGRSIKRRLFATASPLGLVAALSLATASPTNAQSTAQTETTQQQLKQIDVTATRRKPRRRAAPGRQPAVVPAPTLVPVAVPTAAEKRGANIDAAQHQRHRRERKPARAYAMPDAGDGRGDRPTDARRPRACGPPRRRCKPRSVLLPAILPARPPIFSMRGFAGDQINTLYNDIKIGPSTMTGRPMDVGNLEQIEILKGPASLLSGEGATGGTINYVTKKPHTGKIENEAFTVVTIPSAASAADSAPAAARRSRVWTTASMSRGRKAKASSTTPTASS